MMPEPTILELLDTAARAIRGSADKNADFVRGSDYEALLGPCAILWSRQAQRDTDLFKAVNFNSAEGDDLETLIFKRYGKTRVKDTRGTGTAVLRRPAAGIAETIWKGTRIMVPGAQARFYRVTVDKPVGAADVHAELAVEAVDAGTGVAVDLGWDQSRIFDTVTDSTWVVASLKCEDGTVFEKADAFRDRVRRERFEERVGQTKSIIKACEKVGAANVALYRSNFAGDDYDHGLNVAYVGDLGYSASEELVRACTLALHRVRVGGDHLQVLPMTRVELDVAATVTLYDSPALFDLTRLERVHHASVTQYLNGTSGRFTYSLDGLRGAIARGTSEVQRVVLSMPAADDQVVSGTDKNFPDVLNRYVPGKLTFRYVGP